MRQPAAIKVKCEPDATQTDAYVGQVWPSMADVKARINPGSAVVKLIECATKHEGQLQVLALGTQGNHGAKALQTKHRLGDRVHHTMPSTCCHRPTH